MSSPLFLIMGVSGTGKTTIGQQLAKKLGVPFFDGDDFHPQANIEKMSSGIPLDDLDRQDWLKRLNTLAKEHKSTGAVIACSALKESYRSILKSGIENQMQFIFLQGTFDLIKKRMEERKIHFMPLELLQSQFDTLEIPKDAITLSIELPPSALISEILKKKGKPPLL